MQSWQPKGPVPYPNLAGQGGGGGSEKNGLFQIIALINLHICVYIYTQLYVICFLHVSVFACIHTMYVCMYMYLDIYMYICMCMCVCVHVCACTCEFVCWCTCVCVCMCMCICT